jgi:hypothetical protein
MYESTFGTDWAPGDLSADAAVRRTYALGVAASLDREPAGERDRILDLTDSRYQESMLELSYEQGLRRGREHRRRTAEGERDPEAVWATLVVDDGEDPVPGIGEAVRSSDLPASLAVPDLLDRTPATADDSPLDPPDLLGRD